MDTENQTWNPILFLMKSPCFFLMKSQDPRLGSDGHRSLPRQCCLPTSAPGAAETFGTEAKGAKAGAVETMVWSAAEMGWNVVKWLWFFSFFLWDRRDRFHRSPILSHSQDVSGLWKFSSPHSVGVWLGTRSLGLSHWKNGIYWNGQNGQLVSLSLSLSLHPFGSPFQDLPGARNRFPLESTQGAVERWVRTQHGKLTRHREPFFLKVLCAWFHAFMHVHAVLELQTSTMLPSAQWRWQEVRFVTVCMESLAFLDMTVRVFVVWCGMPMYAAAAMPSSRHPPDPRNSILHLPTPAAQWWTQLWHGSGRPPHCGGMRCSGYHEHFVSGSHSVALALWWVRFSNVLDQFHADVFGDILEGALTF